MAITSGFFMSVNGDRKYKADFFAKYFASFIGNGVFPNPSSNMQIMANDDMTVTLKPGKAWIDGYIAFNDDDYILNIDVADGVLNRIDRIVLRLDTTIDREIKVLVNKGAFASSPTAPSLQRDSDAYEIALADIYIGKGAISITQANITDLRLNNELCGIVHGVVDQVDTTTLFAQYASWYTQATGQAEIDIDAMLNQFMSDFNSWYEMNTTAWGNEFDTWFANIKGQLEGDIAANLASQVTDLQTNKADKTDLVSLQTEVSEHLADNANIKHKAKEIGLSSPNFTSVNLDGAVNELFTNVSNGKSAIATAITGKGVVTSGSDTFTQMASNIDSIKVGDYSTGDSIPFERTNVQTGLYPIAKSTVNLNGFAKHIEIDSKGYVYVNTNENRLYYGDGYTTGPNGSINSSSITAPVLDSEDNVYYGDASNFNIYKRDSNFNKAWSIYYPTLPGEITLNPKGGVYHYTAGVVYKITPDGESSTLYSGLEYSNGNIVSDDFGDIYFFRYSDKKVIKINSTGSILWTKNYPVNENLGVVKLIDGEIYVSFNSSGLIYKLSGDGVFSYFYNAGGSYIEDIKSDRDYNLYIMETTNGLKKINKNTILLYSFSGNRRRIGVMPEGDLWLSDSSSNVKAVNKYIATIKIDK